MHRSLDFDDADLATKFLKLDAAERLRQDISELLPRAREIQLDPPILHTFTNIMILRVNMFAPVMKNGILTQCDCGHVVHLQLGRPKLDVDVQ